MITSSFAVGALLRRSVRAFLVEQQMAGRVAEWRELKGWLDSLFVVRADPLVWQSLAEWSERLDAEEGSNG